MNVAALVRGIATLSWLVAIGLIGLSVARAARGQPFKGATSLIIVSVIVALAATSIGSSIIFVQPTERGVVISALQGGVRPSALQPGLNLVVPFLENVIPYNITRQTYTMSIAATEGAIVGDDSVEARTSDGQVVKVDASVIFSIDPERVVETHILWQGRYVDNLIRPKSRGVIRDAVSQFGIEEVYSSQRFVLAEQMRAELEASLVEGGFILHDFVLRNIAFSPEYAASVEQKQIAEQLAKQAALVVEQRTQEAEQARQVAKGLADSVVIAAQGQAEARVIQAEAEARALELIADALRNNPDLLVFEYIQKLAPGIQVMLVPSNNPFLLPLPSLTPAAGTEATVP